MKRKIAIIEDEPAIRANYCDALTKYGYEVVDFDNRFDALAHFENTLPDLVIIDVGLGDDIEGGFEICRQLRVKSPSLPMIFLTARDSELDQILGLKLGADDYLTKDITLPHMMARIVALFRRVEAMQSSVQKHEEQLSRGQLEVNVDRMIVTWNTHLIDLTVTEFWMLHALIKHPGHVKNRTQLMDAANTVLDDNTITSHIKRIRKKFTSIDSSFDSIQTAYGMGYRWKPDDT
ncbi:proteobacterial dedicated sortase system response regulator [Alkalimarinus sediminis]|uniref:Proteobacterial dedicated sortase system response regulator n=1 Tax=Alkalimarinus sediminis TaxID=1632866 RepID=A0A9E8HJL2_9ALTE|nr:proteobacterial dedicated sortase system response regulator [Alkalimarinus sediminis]UZW74547.1 proteobacterial dedicated sortase system response regulator [Alkalimarinus sediminis]